MAQPQGLNIPAIITTGVVGTILTMAIVEGVRAYNNYYNAIVEADQWNAVRWKDYQRLKGEQLAHLAPEGTAVPIKDAMAQIVASGGKRPTTQPTK
jgi:hypothetical protein